VLGIDRVLALNSMIKPMKKVIPVRRKDPSEKRNARKLKVAVVLCVRVRVCLLNGDHRFELKLTNNQLQKGQRRMGEQRRADLRDSLLTQHVRSLECADGSAASDEVVGQRS
jgi:hypothetical protein